MGATVRKVARMAHSNGCRLPCMSAFRPGFARELQRAGRFALAGVIGFALLSGCEDKDEQPVPEAPPPETLPGAWAGVFPCDNCAGIDTTLWLRSDGRFLIEQQYPPGENDGGPALTAHGLGRWHWAGDVRHLVLDGRGPQRVFERPEPDILLMQSGSPLEHRLERNGAASDFPVTIRMTGTVREQGKGHLFTECLTGYSVPLETGGDYPRFARQFRTLVPGGAEAPVELDGRFAWGENGAPSALRLVRLVTIRASGGCA